MKTEQTCELLGILPTNVDKSQIMTIVRAKVRNGMSFKDTDPPKHILTILKNGILFDAPIRNARFFSPINFNRSNITDAMQNMEHNNIQTMYRNGKNSFSSDENGLPNGMAYSNDP